MRSDNPKDEKAGGSPPQAPGIGDIFENAVGLHRAGRLIAAETIYRRILDTEPGHLDSLHMLGVMALQRGDHAAALKAFDAVLDLNPNAGEVFNNRGTALRHLKRLDESLASHDRAIALKPDHAEAFNNRGNALLELKRFDEALKSFDRAVVLKPDYAEAFNNRGAAAHELKRLDVALASYDQAIALKPRYANAFNNRGNVLKELQRVDEALESYDKAIVLNPEHAGAFYNRAAALRDLKRLDEALANYDKAIELDPVYADALHGRGTLNLLRGRYREGWLDYEWRLRMTHRRSPPAINARNWQGEDLAGRRIAIYSEMHFGDVIQFVRYLPLLSGRGANVTFVAPVKLIRLLQPLAPHAALLSAVAPQTPFDFQCALMSLPRWFDTSSQAIPNHAPYLGAEKNLAAHWKDRIGAGGFRIGIAWQGAPQRTFDRRGFALAEVVPLSQLPGVRLISLQKNHGLDELENLPAGTKVETLGDFDGGADAFIDTAAVMENLDLVITSDTSIAHLAGALARPTWVALNHVPEWRWLLDREDSPWYPTMRLFRQKTDGDWRSVFSKMEQELRALLNGSNSPHP